MTTTIYGSNVHDTILSTACQMAPNSGGTEVSVTTTIPGTSQPYAEFRSQGGSSTAVASLPSPTGNGWVWWCGAGSIAAGNWSAIATNSSVNKGVNTVIRFYKISSSFAYTSIGTITVTQTAAGKTTYTYSATAMGSVTTSSGDGVYIDRWWFDNNANSGGDNPVNYVSNSATAGVANDMQVTFPTFTPASTQTNKDVVMRGLISQQIQKDIALRGLISQQIAKDIAMRGNIGVPPVQKDITVRGRISQQVQKDIALRGLISQQTIKDILMRGRPADTSVKDIALRGRISTGVVKDVVLRGHVSSGNVAKDVALRGRVSQLTTGRDIVMRGKISGPRIASGGFTLYANGTGTVSFASAFRATQYPDPALSLAPIIPRIGTTIAAWNALLPSGTSLGVDIGYDGVNWTDITSSNGGSFPTIYSQPEPSIDGFDVDTSANYTSTARTGGSVAAWTPDTTYSRLVATGGVNAIYTYTAINRADVDFFTDMDQSDAGGLVWRFIDASNFYYAVIGDSLASVGTKNTLTIYKVASNVQTTLGTASINFTRGTYHRFRVSMLSGVITIYMDGDVAITYTDGSPLGSGTVGLYNNGGATGSRYYQLWICPQGDYVTGTPAGDIVTGRFVYTRLRLATSDPTVTPQVEDLTTTAATPAIEAGVTIPNVIYDAAFLNSNFDDLGKQSNYSWYVDESRSFVFRSNATVASPWIIQSAPAGLVSSVDLEADDTLELDTGNDLYRNRQRIKGAQDTLTTSAEFIGDGKATSFTLGYPLAEQPTIYLNGVLQSVGLKGLTGYQWYWAVNDPVIEQDSGETVLLATDQLSVPDYIGLFDVSIVVDDVVEQAAHALLTKGTGIVEAVLDVTGQGMRKDAAITLANQLIARYAIAGRTLIFNTSRNGLEVGQALSIFFPERGIFDKQFSITEVDITLKKGVNDTQVWWYKVTASELPKQASWAKIIASGLNLQ